MADTVVVNPAGIGSRPSTRGRPSTADRLTPMPDYLRPISRSDARKWRKLHEDHMMSKLLQKREEKKKLNQLTKQEVWKVARKVPMEMLAKDWMQQIDATVETRAYLVDRILPTLILGVEKLLQEVTRKGITESNAADPIFNPVNFLAQYLMRNNPRFSNFSEASPYVRGLREVGEELRKQLYDIEDNRLVRIKVEARRRREERELAEHMRIMEKQRREDALKKQFLEWDVGNFLDQRVELALIQNALLSFQELAEHFPPELKKSAKLAQPLEPTDDTGRTMGQREFVSYVTQFIEEMPSEVFDQFHMHLSRCALAFRAQHEREERRIVLQQLFISCDHTGVGLIDRHRILNLFEMFWDKARDYIKSTLRNPRRWPVVDVTETSSYDDFDDEETSSEGTTVITETSKEGTKTDGETEPAVNVDSENQDGKTEPAVNVDPENQVTADIKAEEDLDEEEAELAALTDGEAVLPQSADDRPRPPQTTQSKVSFAEGTTFEKDRNQLQSRGSRSQSQASAFDENTLNLSQFVHLCETFLGDEPSMDAFNQLVNFIHDGYMETEDERMARLMKARHEAQAQKRKALLNALFDMWDNDGSGALDLEEVVSVMTNYKDGVEKDAVIKAKKEFKKKTRNHDNRLMKREFRDIVARVIELMSGGDFDYFIDFMTNSVERSYTERVRGEARKKWLQQIINAGETSGVNMEPVYKMVFQALYKDAEQHGNSKIISAYIAMLERNEVVPSRGDFLLRYVASTPDAAPYVLGKALFKDMRGISFASVESGKPIHVPRVGNHGNIHFWNADKQEEEREGSFITVPLKDRRKRVFGLLGIDTLNDPHSRAIFITHEIQFFQGVAKAFSIAYHRVDVRQKTMRISESAVSWIHRRSPNVHDIIVYMVEPDQKGNDYILRKMMITDSKGHPVILKKPPRLERKDNLFRDYLFKCVDNSESVTADAYGERHLAIPLRDDEGMAIVVIDISIGNLKVLPRNESREVMKMLRLLQMAYREIVRESKEGEKTMLLEGEKADEGTRADILFDRLMLMELRDNVSKLDAKAYAELKSYKDPPIIVHQIIRSVLSIFYPDKAIDGEFDNWSNCKQYVNLQLGQKIMTYDPTADDTDENIPVDEIHQYLEDVPHGQVLKHSSMPSQFLYNWVFVCVSLLDHANKVSKKKHKMNDEMTSPPAKKPSELPDAPAPNSEEIVPSEVKSE